MIINKVCKICGKKFTTTNGNAKFCSEECRKKGYQIRQDKFNKSHPGYQREYGKKWRAERVKAD